MDAEPVVTRTPLVGGHLLAAISTSIVGILRDHYGRGPMRAKTYALDDIIVVESFVLAPRTNGAPERDHRSAAGLPR